MKEGFYVEGAPSLVPTLIYNLLRSWYMAVLFMIAGLTTMYSLEKRTVKEYYKERCKRIFLPFIIGIFLGICPILFCIKEPFWISWKCDVCV